MVTSPPKKVPNAGKILACTVIDIRVISYKSFT